MGSCAERPAVPTPPGPLRVRVCGAAVEVHTPVPAVVVRPDGSEVEVPAGSHRLG